MSFWLNTWNKVCGEHKLKTFSCFIYTTLNISEHPLVLKFLVVLKKVIANKWLNGTEEVVGEFKHHHNEQMCKLTRPLSQPYSVYNHTLANHSSSHFHGKSFLLNKERVYVIA